MEKKARNKPEIKENIKSMEIVIQPHEQEAKGQLNKKLITKNESLRAVFLRLVSSLEIVDRLEPVEWLWLGFCDRISESQLEKWINEETQNQESTEFYTNAVYLLKKKRELKKKKKD